MSRPLGEASSGLSSIFFLSHDSYRCVHVAEDSSPRPSPCSTPPHPWASPSSDGRQGPFSGHPAAVDLRRMHRGERFFVPKARLGGGLKAGVRRLSGHTPCSHLPMALLACCFRASCFPASVVAGSLPTARFNPAWATAYSWRARTRAVSALVKASEASRLSD